MILVLLSFPKKIWIGQFRGCVPATKFFWETPANRLPFSRHSSFTGHSDARDFAAAVSAVPGVSLRQVRQLLTCGEQPYGAPQAGSPFDQPLSLQREHHLVHGWRCYAKIPFHVGLRRRSPVDLRVIVDKGQVLPLF